MAGQQPYPSYQGPYPDPSSAEPPVDEYAEAYEEWGEPGEQDSGPEVVVRRRRRGLHIGPLAITPTRVTLLLALIGSSAFLAYAITVRNVSQVPMLASGAAVLGIVFGALAISGVRGSVSAARAGAGGRSFAMAMGGGISALIAAGCLASAIIMALVLRG